MILYLELSHYLLFSILGVVAVSRLYELKLSLVRIRRHQSLGGVLEKENAFLVMVVLHTSLFILVPLEVLYADRPFYSAQFALFFSILVIASFLRFWVLKSLKTHWNVRVISPEEIITTGPYAYIRHPNYVVVMLELLSIPMLHHAWLSAVILSIGNALILYLRISYEEMVLFKNSEYSLKMKDKPRFIPRIIS